MKKIILGMAMLPLLAVASDGKYEWRLTSDYSNIECEFVIDRVSNRADITDVKSCKILDSTLSNVSGEMHYNSIVDGEKVIYIINGEDPWNDKYQCTFEATMRNDMISGFGLGFCEINGKETTIYHLRGKQQAISNYKWHIYTDLPRRSTDCIVDIEKKGDIGRITKIYSSCKIAACFFQTTSIPEHKIIYQNDMIYVEKLGSTLRAFRFKANNTDYVNPYLYCNGSDFYAVVDIKEIT